MYTKDLETKISLRLDNDTFKFVCHMAEVLGITPSAFIRQSLNSLCYNMKGMVDSHADEQTNINNQL